jgi:transposase
MSSSTFTLTPTELEAVDDLIISCDCPHTRRRAEAIKRLHEGQTPRAAAEAVGVTARTVRTWLKRYRQEGLDGLRDRPRAGRPSKASAEYKEVLQAILEESPFDFDYEGAVGWTVRLLRDCMARKTGITLSDGRMRVLLHRLGYQYREVPSVLQELMPPFPSNYDDMKAWMELEDTLRARLPEHKCVPVRTWVRAGEEDAMP